MENNSIKQSTCTLINYDLETVLSTDANNKIQIQKSKSEKIDLSKKISKKNKKKNLVSITEDELTSRLNNLQVSQRVIVKSNDNVRLAGYVKSTIPQMKMIVVQVATGSKILDVGTTIFTTIERLFDDEDEENKENVNVGSKNYLVVGRVDDIVGSVGEPMYSLEMQSIDPVELVIDSKVYYFDDHPDTKYVIVKRDKNNRYTVVQNCR